MTERRETREREREDRETTGAFGTMFGATFGPLGAAVGSVFDANRVAFTFSFGTGVPGSTRRDDDDGLDGAATIEIEDTGDVGTTTGDGAQSDAESDGETGDATE